jgi:hypothetical protein
MHVEHIAIVLLGCELEVASNARTCRLLELHPPTNELPKVLQSRGILQAQKGKNFIYFHHTEYNIASAYALMHKDTLAIQWLQMAAGEGFPCYPVFARDPNLANLRNDPRFVKLLADQKKQWEYYKSGL